MRVFAGILTIVVLLSACAPIMKPPGPDLAEPRLDGTTYVTADGARLPVRSWIPTTGPVKAIVIAVHGFNDYSNFFETPAYFLAGYSIASYAYDQRGFGKTDHRGFWPGVTAYAHDLSVFTRLVRAQHPDVPVYLLGVSMGGAVAMVAMTSVYAPQVDGVILSAPAVWGRVTMPWYQRFTLAVASHTVPWLTLTGRSLRKTPSDNIDMLRELSRDPLVIKETRVDTIYGLVNLMDAAFESVPKFNSPSLIMYGQKDEIIPSEPTYEVFQRFREAARSDQRMAIYKTGYHMLLRDLQAHIVLDDIAVWIADRSAPLPSGADRRAVKFLASEQR